MRGGSNVYRTKKYFKKQNIVCVDSIAPVFGYWFLCRTDGICGDFTRTGFIPSSGRTTPSAPVPGRRHTVPVVYQ